MFILPSSVSRVGQAAKSAAVVLCGLAGLGKRMLAGEGAVLAFHGLRADEGDAGVGDTGLHLRISVFKALCGHLARDYEVMKLGEMAEILETGGKLPQRAVALTFDDGYASNYELGYPVMKELGLPATIFLATGFLDGDAPLWFQQVDLALGRGGQVQGEGDLGTVLRRLKRLPDEGMREEVRGLVESVRGLPMGEEEVPAVMRPMTWGQAREMLGSGLIDLGGHTHTHPILARCGVEKQRWELEMCRERMRTELGVVPKLFAFPNGGAGDCTEETLRLLKETGFDAAWTMVSGRVRPGLPPMMQPRYGAPESLWELEATVSGAFELPKRWKETAI